MFAANAISELLLRSTQGRTEIPTEKCKSRSLFPPPEYANRQVIRSPQNPPPQLIAYSALTGGQPCLFCSRGKPCKGPGLREPMPGGARVFLEMHMCPTFNNNRTNPHIIPGCGSQCVKNHPPQLRVKPFLCMQRVPGPILGSITQ